MSSNVCPIAFCQFLYIVLLYPGEKAIRSGRLNWEREKSYLQSLLLELFMWSYFGEGRLDSEQAVGRNPLISGIYFYSFWRKPKAPTERVCPPQFGWGHNPKQAKQIYFRLASSSSLSPSRCQPNALPVLGNIQSWGSCFHFRPYPKALQMLSSPQRNNNHNENLIFTSTDVGLSIGQDFISRSWCWC